MKMSIDEFWNKRIKSLPDWWYFAVVLFIALLILYVGAILSDYISSSGF